MSNVINTAFGKVNLADKNVAIYVYHKNGHAPKHEFENANILTTEWEDKAVSIMDYYQAFEENEGMVAIPIMHDASLEHHITHKSLADCDYAELVGFIAIEVQPALKLISDFKCDDYERCLRTILYVVCNHIYDTLPF